ncbi:hypothetical protein [Flavivirga eckloniae]|nr:hypothetical protein [Flavivirga eckloniae]
MKQVYTFSLTLLFSSFLSLNTQSLLGVDTSIDLAHAGFQNDFV